MSDPMSVSAAPVADDAAGLDTALFEQNLRAFEEFLPTIAEMMRDLHARGTISKVVGSEHGEDLNIDLGHDILYAEDAHVLVLPGAW